MENASKALIIAGSILIAIITISLFVVMYNNLNAMATAQEDKKATQELAAFNAEYEAYNKRVMYGVDVITVVNKAIENNKKMQVEGNFENKYYVNIIFKLKEDVETTGVKRYTKNEGAKTIDVTEKILEAELQEAYKEAYKTTDAVSTLKLEKEDNPISLLKWKANETDVELFNNGVIEFFSVDPKDKFFVQETNVGNLQKGYTYYIYSGLTNFKKAIFECENVTYNGEGRIREMTFEQIKTI